MSERILQIRKKYRIRQSIRNEKIVIEIAAFLPGRTKAAISLDKKWLYDIIPIRDIFWAKWSYSPIPIYDGK